MSFCPTCGRTVDGVCFSCGVTSSFDWKESCKDLKASRFKPFQRGLCPVTGKLEELDPVCGLSIDGISGLVRRGELNLPIGWGLNPTVGFETRFHSRRISNITFRLLPAGFSRGSMLVNLNDDELWMRNLDTLSGDIDFGGETKTVANLWRNFLQAVLCDLTPVYEPPRDGESEWFSFTADVLVQGLWCSIRPPTAAGCTVDVPNFSGSGPSELPCEIPLSFRDCDYLHTSYLLDSSNPPLGGVFLYLAENFFSPNGKPTSVLRLIEENLTLSDDEVFSFVDAGHGFLAMLKASRNRFGLSVSIPPLELRDVLSVSASAAR